MNSTVTKPETATGGGVLRLLLVLLALAGLALGVFAWYGDSDEMGGFILLLPGTTYALAVFMIARKWSAGAPAGLPEGWVPFARVNLILYVAALLGVALIGGISEGFGLAATSATAVATLVLLIAGGAIARAAYLGTNAPAGPILANASTWARLDRFLMRLARFLTPSRALGYGATLALLSTLLTATLMGSCGGDPRPGYQIISGEADWVTVVQGSLKRETFQGSILLTLGRVFYSTSVLLAVVTLGLLAVSVRQREAMQPSALLRWLTALTGLTAGFAISDFCFYWLQELGWTWELWVVYWGLPVGIWLACHIPRDASFRQPWAVWKQFLSILYFPVLYFGVGLLTFAVGFTVYGYACFIAGSLLLWWGYLQLSWLARAERPDQPGLPSV